MYLFLFSVCISLCSFNGYVVCVCVWFFSSLGRRNVNTKTHKISKLNDRKRGKKTYYIHGAHIIMAVNTVFFLGTLPCVFNFRVKNYHHEEKRWKKAHHSNLYARAFHVNVHKSDTAEANQFVCLFFYSFQILTIAGKRISWLISLVSSFFYD